MRGIRWIILTFAFAMPPISWAFAQTEIGSEDWHYEVSKAIALSLAETTAWEYALPYLQEIGPKTTDWNLLLFQAKVEQRRGDIAAAKVSIQRALASHDKNPRILVSAGNIALDDGRPQDAVDYFERARQIQPENPAILSPLGRLRCARREWAMCVELYETLIHHATPTSEVCVRLATAYENLGDLENAEKYLKRNLAIHPNRAIALIPLERFYRAHQRTERADAVARELKKLEYHDGNRRDLRALRPSSR